MGKYEDIDEAVAQNPTETEASHRIGSDDESFSDGMPAATGAPEETGDHSIDEQLAEAMANEEAEEAKVAGDDGHEPLSSGPGDELKDELDELSDGEMGEAAPTTGAGEAPVSEAYVESSAAEDLFEVSQLLTVGVGLEEVQPGELTRFVSDAIAREVERHRADAGLGQLLPDPGEEPPLAEPLEPVADDRGDAQGLGRNPRVQP